MKILIYIIIASSTISLYSQNYSSNWVFGDGAWINFNDNTSDPLFVERAAINQYEGCTSLSDKNGVLLFYSDGVSVWNRYHQTIANGTGLKGSWTSSQSAHIVPFPNNKNKFYIITPGATEKKNETIYYSIIDTSGGYSNSTITIKNTELNSNYDGERVAIVKQPSNNNYWLILNDIKAPEYLVYEITDNGINLKSTYNGGLSKVDNHGSLKISTNSNLIISPNSDRLEFEILRFNPFKGEIYENVVLTDSKIGTTIYGVEFSPNSNFAYISANTKQNGSWFTIVTQFDIIEWFKNKKIFVSTLTNNTFTWRNKSNESLQLAPNNKIYVAVAEANYLNSIESPNLKSPLCNFKSQSVDLKNTKSKLGLPGRVVEPIINYKFIDTIVCDGIDFLYETDFGNNAFWVTPNKGTIFNRDLKLLNFSELDTGYYHLYDENSELRLILHIDYASNKILKFVEAIPNNSFCPNDSVLIKVNDEVDKIIWSDGSTSKEFYAKRPGKYKFTVFLSNGCVLEDEIEIYIKNIKPIISTNDSHCELDFGILFTREKFDKYEWSDGSTNDSLIVTKSGKYWLKVTSWDGCIGYDTINIDIKDVDVYDLIPDSLFFCPEKIAEYSIEDNQKFKSIEWSHGKFGSITQFDKSGIYTIIAYDENGCPHYDTTYVTIFPIVEIEFEILEEFFCISDSAFIKIKERENTIFTWYDGRHELARYMNKVGTFDITAKDTLTGCISKTSIALKNHPNVNAQIKTIGSINPCSGEPTLLKSRYTSTDFDYYWDGVLGDDSLEVINSGTHKLLIVNRNTGCKDSATIDVIYAEQMDVRIEGNDICEGDTTILNVYPENPEFTYKWSTGETTPSIQVTTASKLTVLVSNGTCTDTATYTVNVYPNPIVSIEGTNEICYGDTTSLSSPASFKSYLWSNGDTTNSISISQPGKYTLQVTDLNGCKGMAEYEVFLYQYDISLSSNSIDYGKVYLGSTKLDSILIVNHNNEDIHFEYLNKGNLKLKDKFVVRESFEAVKLGEYQDTIWFKITYPCDSTFYVTKTASVYTKALVTTTNIKSKIGFVEYIPFYIEGPNEIGNLNLNVKADILETLFYAHNGLSIMENVTVTKNRTQFFTMPGTILLTDRLNTAISFKSIISDNQYVEFENIPGSIEVDSICVFDFRDIKGISNVSISNKVENGLITIIMKSVEPSTYTFDLFSIDGKQVVSEIESINQFEYQKTISTKQLSNGLYFLKVSSPYKTITRKFIITQ
ncbi:MAG: T9SS type A sorting domain-containing protein [Candidatus Kapaibacterium sp.]